MFIALGIFGYLLIAIFLGIVVFDRAMPHDPESMFWASLFWIITLPIATVAWLAIQVRAILDGR